MKKHLVVVERHELEEAFRAVAAEVLSGVKSDADAGPDYLTRDELCKYLGISLSTLYYYEKSGIVNKIKQGRRNLYLRSEIDQLKRSGKLQKYSARISYNGNGR